MLRFLVFFFSGVCVSVAFGDNYDAVCNNAKFTAQTKAYCKADVAKAKGQPVESSEPVPVSVDDGSPVVESSVPAGSPSVPVVESSVPASTPPVERVLEPSSFSVKLVLEPLRVTEHEMRDGGAQQLPVWIEVYNPNSESVSMAGWTLTWATRKFANAPWTYHVHTIGAFSVPAESAVILVSKRLSRAWQFGGVTDAQVYDLGIRHGRLLKSGWRLADADGQDVFSVGRAFGKGGPVLRGSWQSRVSHELIPSGSPSVRHFYGSSDDVGSPGYFVEASVPGAPSAVRRGVGLWADMKRH